MPKNVTGPSRGQKSLTRLWVLTLAVAAVVWPFVNPPYSNFRLTSVFFYLVVAMGLNLLTGYTGQISLGHSAFFALGAYIGAIVATSSGLPYLVAFPIAVAAGYVTGYLFGKPALRLKGLYLAMVTLALALVTPIIIRQFDRYTGGGEGMLVEGVSTPSFIPLADDQWLYLVGLVVAVIAFVTAKNLIRSGSGLAMMAVRDNEIAAQVAGIDIARVKCQGFAISAAFAAAGGTLYAFVVQFVGPDAFHLMMAVAFLTAIVVGGLGRVSGAVYGAFFLVFAPTWTSQINQALSGFMYGALLIIVMIAMPSGIAGLVTKALDLIGGTFRRLRQPTSTKTPVRPTPVRPTLENEGQ